MKLKLAIIASLLLIAVVARAETLHIVRSYNSTEVYFVDKYECDYTNLKSALKVDNGILPVKDNVLSRELVVGDKIASVADKHVDDMVTEFMRGNKGVQEMIKKARAFEDAGNIAALNHWSAKIASESKIVKYKFEQLEYNLIVAKYGENIANYHQTIMGSARFNSLDDLKMGIGRLCK